MHSTKTMTKKNSRKPLKGSVYILSTTDKIFSPNNFKKKKKITTTVGLKYLPPALQY